MISWIQNHLIRHGRWIFLTLLTVIIVAFVFTIGNTPGCTSNQSGYQEQKFYSYDLNSPREMGIISETVSLSALLTQDARSKVSNSSSRRSPAASPSSIWRTRSVSPHRNKPAWKASSKPKPLSAVPTVNSAAMLTPASSIISIPIQS